MNKVALVTGSAKRIGRCIVQWLHAHDYNVVIHCNRSIDEAKSLCDSLNKIREHSAVMVQADLADTNLYPKIIDVAIDAWGRLDVLVHNASIFHKIPFLDATEQDWDNTVTTNLKAIFFLSQLAAPHLTKVSGNIIMLSDIWKSLPHYQYSIYSLTKAGVISLTKSLAQELAPVRVNGVAPGPVIEPNTNVPIKTVTSKFLVDAKPSEQYIAEAVGFLLNSPFITGETIHVDGGKSLLRN